MDHIPSIAFAYTVTATFAERAVALEWLRWLTNGHVAEILAAGATNVEITILDGPDLAVEVRYHFDSRAAFAEYEQLHAPRLRAEGLRLFPPERGIGYRRSTGEVIHRRRRQPGRGATG